MKLTRLLLLAVLMFAASFSLHAAEKGDQWWNIPYPGRFVASTLVQDQDTIRVDGNGFVNSEGKRFVFRGVSIADPDKLDLQGKWDKALFEELDRWGANHIRLPIHPIAWRQRGDAWYFARIDEAVTWANSLDMYLIIDWHSIGNLEAEMFQHPPYVTDLAETRDFWKSIAYRYKDVPTVAVYELFNEPTDNFIGAGKGSLGKANWDDWRDTLEDLIDLVYIYDSTVIPLVGGFNWAYDLSHVAERPIRREGVAYAIHPYPQKAKPDENTRAAFSGLWQKQWGYVADNYPMIATEIGWVKEDGYGSHIPVINNDGTYGPNLVRFMEERGISWTGWCFDPNWSPTMISDWDFTPTEQGRFYKEVMQRTRNGPLAFSVMPSPRVIEYDWMTIVRWQEMHAEDVAIAEKGGVDLLFLGDSITEGWPDHTWEAHFSQYKPANFGIGGDRTENLRWRLLNGATGELDPRVVVIMIGVNNFGLGDDSASDVYLGVKAVIEDVKTSFSGARIVLLGILPYGEHVNDPDRQRVIDANILIASLAEDPVVDFHDIGAAFLQEDGSISAEVMPDFLHPTQKGYDIYAEKLNPVLLDLFK